jgi:high affinity sulfate transporter 1
MAAAPGPIVSVLEGIRPYRPGWLRSDLVAGITLAALAIPEVMGYTRIAGTPVVTGLYTLLLPVIAFALLGSSRHLVVGADSATAAIMFAGIAGLGIAGVSPGTDGWLALASLSCLIVAALLLVARVARLGFLADFISRSVLVGFLTGVGVQVAAGQVGGMLGIPKPDVQSGRLSGTLLVLGKTLTSLGTTSLPTLAVSAAVIAILVVFERWITAIPGGLVAIVGAILVSWAANLSSHGVAILGPVPSGLPHLGLPSGVGWGDVGALVATAVSMFVVILAQSEATSRAYAVKYQERIRANSDLVGLGIANLAAGLSGTFVVNGSPTKTEMVDEAKSHTQIAQLTTAACVAIVLLFLTRPLQYLPLAALSAVVFVVGLKMVDLRNMRRIWRTRRDEFWVAAITTVVVIGVGVEQGIILAIVLSILLHVRRHYSPPTWVVAVDGAGHVSEAPPTPGATTAPGLVVYRFGVGIFFANANRMMEEALSLVDVPHPPRWFVLLVDAVDDIDFTGGTTLVGLADELTQRGIVFGVAGASDAVKAQLDRFGVTDRAGAAHVFGDLDDALAAFRDAPAAT